MINIAVLKHESDPRIAMSPSVAKKLASDNISITVIGDTAPERFQDIKNVKTSGKIADISKADILISTILPSKKEVLDKLKSGALIIALDLPIQDEKLLGELKEKKLKFLALNKIPRITRAQTMDVLSSQSNIAGYRAVIETLYEYTKVCPMMMTAAGTIKPAKVLVVGAGVAGLQAIATARRMGAIVAAFDVRSAAKEQVESLGAKFIEVGEEVESETSGGYAKEMSEEYKKKQAEKLAEEVANSDIVITTAQIPNRPAPRLITSKMVESMRKGSVILDMAVETGGNCEGSAEGKIVDKNGVKIIGYTNLAGKVMDDSSNLFAQNIYNLLKILIVDDNLKLDTEDEIIKSSLIIH